MNFYVNHLTNCKVPIETTNIPHHLDRLLDILLIEENQLGTENPGPCLEYLLQHRLLDLLATLASAESPPGMRFVCLSFLRRLLTRLQHPLLPHVSVYSPVQRLIGLCNGNVASPTENEEIQFLVALCFLICKHPNLTYIMNNVKIPSQKQNALAGSTSNKLDTQQITYAPTRTRNNSNPLFEPLNTQAVTLINPNLHHSEGRRKLSRQSSRHSVPEAPDEESTTIATEHRRKISNLSSISFWSDDIEFSHQMPDLSQTPSGSPSSVNGIFNQIETEDKCLRKTSNGSTNTVEEIEAKLQDLRELQIDDRTDYHFTAASSDLDKALANNKLFEDGSKAVKAQLGSSDPSSPTKSTKCLLLDALISYLNSAVGI